MPNIDKSVLTFGTKQRVEDRKYLDSYKDSVCQASSDGLNICGHPSIGAHCRTGLEGGTGFKPSDDLTWPLCDAHHRQQEEQIGADWWLRYVLKPMMRRRYKRWKAGK